MRLQVVHETRYRYSSPVLLSQQLLHLTPRALPWQAVLSHRITIEPTAGEFDEHEDYYGNPTVHMLLAAPHEQLVVRAESEVGFPNGPCASESTGRSSTFTSPLRIPS